MNRFANGYVRIGNFNRALDLMNQAMEGKKLPGLQENMVYFTAKERRFEQQFSVIALWHNFFIL